MYYKKQRLVARVGLVLMALGGLFLIATGGYYAISAYAYTRLSGLNATAAPDVLNRDIPEGWQRAEPKPKPDVGPASTTDVVRPDNRSSVMDGPAVDIYSVPSGTASPTTPLTSTRANSSVERSGEIRPVKWDDLPQTRGKAPPAKWFRIPAIGVDSKVVELNTVWKDSVLEWETPKWAVGHHNGTANPGERNNMVLSGHISSPLTREGEVFKRLPEIPKLLDSGQIVDIIVSTEDTRFLYRAVKWELVKPEQLDVFAETSDPTVTLITCYPDFAYWDRLIITGKLVGIAPITRE